MNTKTVNPVNYSLVAQQSGQQQQEKVNHALIAKERAQKWKEEQTLLIDSSRYMKPITLTSLEDSASTALVLPSRPVQHPSTDWFTLTVVLSAVLITVVKFSFGKYLSSLFQSIVNYPASTRLFREQNISLKQGAFVLEIFYFLVLGLFGYQLVNHFGIRMAAGNFVLFLVCFAAILLYFALKGLVYRTLGFISETTVETSEYLFNMRNHNKVLGIALLPVVCLTAWAPVHNPLYFLIAGLVMTALLYLKTLQRGVLILLKKQFSVFYLFLYLCTLEILPLLLFIKVI